MKTLTCGIIGRGPLGIALAHRLTKAGVSVGLYARSGAGPVDEVVDGERLTLADCDIKECELVLSAVPAHAVAETFVSHAAGLRAGTPWINLSNGMVWDELSACAQRHPNVIPRAGVVQFGAKEEAGVIVTTGTTDVRWGPLMPARPTAAEAALTRLDGWSWNDNVKEWLVLKWIFNSVLNSHCAAFDWSTNGVALRHWPRISAAVDEAVALADELWGVRFENAKVAAQLKALVEKTATNQNSMVRALSRGARTEHDALLGWVHQAKGSFPELRKLASQLEKKLTSSVP